MKRVIRCAEDKLNNSGLYSVDDMSFKDAKNLIKNSLSTAEYIQISYYDPFAHTTSGTAFKRIDGE